MLAPCADTMRQLDDLLVTELGYEDAMDLQSTLGEAWRAREGVVPMVKAEPVSHVSPAWEVTHAQRLAQVSGQRPQRPCSAHAVVPALG